MRLCIFEDPGVELLEPIALTRPAFDLWCGATTLLGKHIAHSFGTASRQEVGALVRPVLAALCRANHPHLAVNDVDWLRRGPTVYFNARWLPPGHAFDEAPAPRIGLFGQQVAYIVGAAPPESYPESLEDWLEHCKKTLPQVQAGGVLLEYLWDFVDHNPAALTADLSLFRPRNVFSLSSEVTTLGPRENVVVVDGATIEPFVVADTRKGPVIVDAGATVHSFSRLEGPCYVGRESCIAGAKLRTGTFGPQCRIGGEVEASIVQGYTNKYHDGFLGHSYVGSWVNLAAGTQTSDLRNDYGMIKVHVAGARIATGRNKVGSFVGDHTKTGLGTLFNTGTSVGAFCNVLSSGALSPGVIPSFCQYHDEQLQERWDLRQLFQTAHITMRRRGCELTDPQKDFFYTLYDHTAQSRARQIRLSEQRRLRRSV